LKTKDNVTDDDIRGLMRLASSRGHFAFAEVCASALEREVLPGNPGTNHSRVRCAEALNTGIYVNAITKDLPRAEQKRIRHLAAD
jgi:hypothetical protein